jgi:hypothetical protein
MLLCIKLNNGFRYFEYLYEISQCDKIIFDNGIIYYLESKIDFFNIDNREACILLSFKINTLFDYDFNYIDIYQEESYDREINSIYYR